MLRSIRYARIPPPSIDTPPDIRRARSGDDIPPGVDISGMRISPSPDIMPSICYEAIEPGTLKWMKSYFSIIGFRTCEIDLMMSAVYISSPEHCMPMISQGCYVRSECLIEYELPLPGIFGLPSVREVDPEDIQHLARRLLCQLRVSYTSLIGIRISWHLREESDFILFEDTLMYPHACPSISWLLCGIIVCHVWHRRYEL